MKRPSRARYDVCVIGAGIVGSMVGRALSRYRLDVLLLEKEADIGIGTSSANSAIIHAGHDPEPGSLKAELNIRGNAMWGELAEELGIPFRRTGSYVVALDREEEPALEELFRRGKENGLSDHRIIGAAAMKAAEPLVNPSVRSALWTPSAGIIDPFSAVLATCSHAAVNGVELLMETPVTGITVSGRRVKAVRAGGGEIACRWVVNCAGLYADRIMNMADDRPDFSIIPRKGEYLVFDRADVKLDNVLFPAPRKGTKGTLVTATMHGNVLVGPNACRVEDREDRDITREGLEQILASGRRLVPSLDTRAVIAQYAGVRATGNLKNRDFLIAPAKSAHGLIHAAGIDSPGLAASPAIAEKVLDIMREQGEDFREKKDWKRTIPERSCFRLMTHAERKKLAARDPLYANVVCRCENVTEGEILDAVRGPVPAMNYDAVKRRTWLGTGRCQGSFDYPRVIRIMARELGVPMTAVTKKGKGSEFLVRRTKEADG